MQDIYPPGASPAEHNIGSPADSCPDEYPNGVASMNRAKQPDRSSRKLQFVENVGGLELNLKSDEPPPSQNGHLNMAHSPFSRLQESPHPNSVDSSVRDVHDQNLISEVTPPRQDSAYYSGAAEDTSESGADVQARHTRAQERLARLRRRVLRTRIARKERKPGLRKLRENARDAAAGLTRRISEIVALRDVGSLESIIPYYEKLVLAQDELGPQEEEYDRLETRLDDEEQDLEQEEEEFYRSQNISTAADSDPDLEHELSPIFEPYQLPDSELEEIALGGDLLQDYLEKFDEAEQLKCELDELEDDYNRHSRAASFRKRLRIPISNEITFFLADYEKRFANTLRNLHIVEDDLLDLRDKCLDEQLFTDSEYPYELRDTLFEDIMSSVDEIHKRYPLRRVSDLLDYSQHEIDFNDKRDYVNKWLFQWIQDSSPETSRLRDYVLAKHPGLSEDIWPELVLEQWDKDEAGLLATQAFNASKMDTIEGNTQARLPSTAKRTGFSGSLSHLRSFPNLGSLDVDLDDDGDKEEELIGSDTGSHATQKRFPERPMLKRRSSSAPPYLSRENSP